MPNEFFEKMAETKKYLVFKVIFIWLLDVFFNYYAIYIIKQLLYKSLLHIISYASI